ncbi:MAG TPA: FimV/HubP family polar landmark protein [Gammaproteobacteria bacterium]|nr:FimV/HubP family polar landmark protein [Gammaproteobacteria bacterium]
MASSLGSPLQASAPLRLSGGESAGDLEASIASESDYKMVGKSMPAAVSALQVRLEDGDSPVIRITSSRPIEDPLFEVMVRVTSGDNQVLKMFTVTLDPPEVSEPESRSAASRPAPPPAAAQPAGGGQARVRTRELPAQARREAEAGPAVKRPDVQVTEGWAKRDRYGPVRSGDTLTTIVQRLRRQGTVPLDAAVVATWKANPDAFIDGNMNLVRQGAVLDVPSQSQVRRYSTSQAKAIIRKQRKEWRSRGEPGVKTSPGHERYRLKVSLASPDDESASAPAKESPQDQKSAGAEQTAANQSGADTGGGEAGQEEAGGGAGSGTGESPENAAMVAELRGRISDLQKALDEQRGKRQDAVDAMQKRLAGMQDKLDKQRKLVAQQNATMKRLSSQGAGGSMMAGRERYILGLLAGINLLMLLAIVALWLRLRAVRKEGGGDGGGAGAGNPDEPSDPVTKANLQAAAGELKQARSTLWQAVADNPRNWAVYGRLLDLYEQEDDADQFEEVARRLFDQLGDEQPEWQEEIRTRGRRIMPESTLFAQTAAAGAGAGAAASASAAPGPAFDFEGLDLEGPEAASPGGEPAPEAAEEEGLDLDFGGDSAEGPGEAPAASEEAPAGGEEEDLDLAFDLEGPGSGPEEGPGAGEEAATASAGEDEEGDLDFELGLPGEEEEASAAEEAETPAPTEAEGDDLLALSGWESEAEEGPEGGPAGSESGEEAPPAGDELDFDLDLGEPEPAEPPAGAGTEAGGGDELGELDLGDFDTGGAATAPEPESGGEEAGSDLDLELPGWEDEQAGEESGPGGEAAEEETAPARPATPSAEEPAAADGGGDEDEFEIKLDLAQAWIDMGDQESARGLLEEVEGRGAPQQQERARKLIASLA